MSACTRYCQRAELGFRDPLVEALAEVARLTSYRDWLDRDVSQLEARVERLTAALGKLMAAAKNMPLYTPKGGGAGTKHTYQIAASEVWALDRALREANELTNG